jgi:hypothetical protein
MNRSERRLSQELDRAATARQVDVDQLWQAVRERTAGTPGSAPPAAHPPRWRRRLTPYLAAASVAGIFVVAALFANGNKPSGPTTTPEPVVPHSTLTNGPLSSAIGAWACQNRREIEPGINSVTGKPVRAVLDPDETPPEAIAYGVPRYQFTLHGTTGVLDYGDSSGRRIARTELTHTTTGWLVGRRTTCSGPAGGMSPDPAGLGQYMPSPLPLDPQSAQVKATPPIGDPIVLDDRRYYDSTGMLRHRTLYVFAVEGGYQFASMPADGSYRTGAQTEDTIGAADMSPPAGTSDTYIYGGSDRLGLVLTYLTSKKTVEGLTSRDAATGATGAAQQFTFPDGRTLYTVVPAPARQGGTLVTVHRSTGDDPPRRF